jgi:hypothetical protein
VAALERVAHAIAVHDVPYSRFTARQEHIYRQAPHLTEVLKAADCMDRYRLPLKRWWPDTARLSIEVPDWLPPAPADGPAVALSRAPCSSGRGRSCAACAGGGTAGRGLHGAGSYSCGGLCTGRRLTVSG